MALEIFILNVGNIMQHGINIIPAPTPAIPLNKNPIIPITAKIILSFIFLKS